MYKWSLMEESISFLDKIRICKFILTNSKYSKGEYVKKFEQEWSKWLGVKYTVFVNSGSSANLILVDAIKEKYKLSKGDKVLVPACTWATNISPIVQCGLQPVFCDIQFSNFSFDITKLEAIAKEHDIKAIFITHLLGLPSDMDELKKIFPNTIMIEDCCESHGATYEGKKVGTLSEGSTFSFYYGHHMTSIEGGVICTDDYELYKLILLKRSHGLARELPEEEFQKFSKKYPDIDKRFLFLTHGYNLRPTELNAVIGLQQLPRIDSFIENRRKVFKFFIDESHKRGLDEIFWIPNPEGNSSFCFPIVLKDGDKYQNLLSDLENAGIETRPIVGSNLTRQPFLSTETFDQSLFPNANDLHNQGIYIGNNQFVTIDRVKGLLDILERLK